MINNKLGRRKPTIYAGQLLKALGTTIAILGSDSIVVMIIGIGIFGIASGLWLPAFFGIPTEIEGMDSNMVAAAFAFMSSCGFAMGFVAPAVGGLLTNFLIKMAPVAETAHAFGLKWSLFILGLINFVAFFIAFFIPETGSKKKA